MHTIDNLIRSYEATRARFVANLAHGADADQQISSDWLLLLPTVRDEYNDYTLQALIHTEGDERTVTVTRSTQELWEPARTKIVRTTYGEEVALLLEARLAEPKPSRNRRRKARRLVLASQAELDRATRLLQEMIGAALAHRVTPGASSRAPSVGFENARLTVRLPLDDGGAKGLEITVAGRGAVAPRQLRFGRAFASCVVRKAALYETSREVPPWTTHSYV